MNHGRRGFTLIELLFVVALISIMLVIAVPSFTSFISNYRATSAVNELLQGVMLTRGEALKRGRRVVMLPNDALHNPSVSGAWSNGWTVFVDFNNDQQLQSTDALIYRHADLPPTIAISAPATSTTPFGNANYVSFDGTGYPRRVDGSQLSGGIVVTDQTGSNTSTRTLCLAKFGRPRTVSGPADPCTD